MNMFHLRQRVISLVAILFTALLLVYTLGVSGTSLDWLHTDYDLTKNHLLGYYIVWLAVLVPIALFEPRIRAELQDANALGAVLLAGGVISALAMTLLYDDQPYRLFRQVPIFYTALAHVVIVVALLASLAIKNPLQPLTPRMVRYLTLLLAVMFLLLVTAHIISLGKFVRLDDVFDEFILGAILTNVADHGILTSSFTYNIYGDFDPSWPRFFWLGGVWLRLFEEQTLAALRSWSLLVAGIGLVMTSLALWREQSLHYWQRLAGLVLLLASGAFVRASHNIRMDIGLVVYAALLLWVFLEAERVSRPGRWMFAAGLVVYIGLETQTLSALMHGISYGVVLLVTKILLGGGQRWQNLRQWILPYVAGAVLAVMTFLLVHLTPNFQEKLDALQDFSSVYVGIGSVTQGVPFQYVRSVFDFSLAISPVEPFLIIGLLVYSLRDARLRPYIAVAVLSLMLNWTLLSIAFGYNNLLLPIIVLCMAHMLRHRLAALVIGFVVLPAVVAVPMHDMTMTTRANRNEMLINELHLLDWRIPDGAHVVGSDIFWITLQERTQFTGASGLIFIADRLEIPLGSPDLLEAIGVDVVICHPEIDAFLCELADAYFETEPISFAVTAGTYQVYLPGE